MAKSDKNIFHFDSFCVDAQKRLLSRGGEALSLTPKAFDTLLALVENRGRVIEKDELMQAVWPDTIVEESALSRNIYLLRKALGESPDDHRYIVTVPGRGYRFVAQVTEPSTDPAELIVATKARAAIVTEEEEWGNGEGQQQVATGPAEKEIFNASPSLDLSPSSSALPAPRSPRLPLAPTLLGGAAMIVILAFALQQLTRGSKPAGNGLEVKSLAVLPFKPLVAESSDEYLQMGMADVLITRLSVLRQIIVRPMSAVRKYVGLDQDAVAAGRDLKVEAVLDGSIQRVGDRVRLTARLINVSDGATLWAEKFDEKFTDLLSVEDRLSEKLVGALAIKLTGEEKRLLAKRYTENLDAYQAYLRGRFFWSKWTRASLEKGIGEFDQALTADPDYAPAYSGKADAWNLLGYLGFLPTNEAFPKSEAAALRALQLDDSLGEAHISLAKTKLFYDWDWSKAESEIKRAIELAPNYADAHGTYGAYLTAVGRFDEALAERMRALELDPTSPLFTTMVGWVYFYQHRYDQAISWYRKALELDPNFMLAHNDLGVSLYFKGDLDQAMAQILDAKTRSGESRENVASLKEAYSAAGVKGYWRKELELAQERSQRGQSTGPWRMARIYAELGEKDRAFELLDQAYQERVSLLTFIKFNPIFETLHSDPRFDALLRRIGFTP